MKLLQESYNNQSFLEIASEFIEELRKKFDHEWRKKGGDSFQDSCIAYLFEKMPIESEEVKEKIGDRFKPLPQEGAKNILLELAKGY